MLGHGFGDITSHTSAIEIHPSNFPKTRPENAGKESALGLRQTSSPTTCTTWNNKDGESQADELEEGLQEWLFLCVEN